MRTILSSLVQRRKYDFTVCLSGTKDYAFAIANVLIGLKKNNPTLVDHVVIYHDGFSEKDKKALSSIYDCIDFELYLPSRNEHLKNIVNFGKAYEAWPYPCFGIFEIFALARQSKTVVYLDGDVLVQGDISGLTNLKGVAMKAGGRISLSQALGIHNEELAKIDCRNAGVVVVNSGDYSFLTDLCYELADQYKETNKLPDQSILNLALFKANIEITDLPAIYNEGLNKSYYKNRIIHQTTKKKFWSNGIVGSLCPDWIENNEAWLSLGGSPYKGTVTQKECFSWHKNYFAERLSIVVSIFASLRLDLFKELISTFEQYIPKNDIRVKDDMLMANLPSSKNNVLRYEVRVLPEKIITKIYSTDSRILEISDCDVDGIIKVDNRTQQKFGIQFNSNTIEILLKEEERSAYKNKVSNFVSSTFPHLIKKD